MSGISGISLVLGGVVGIAGVVIGALVTAPKSPEEGPFQPVAGDEAGRVSTVTHPSVPVSVSSGRIPKSEVDAIFRRPASCYEWGRWVKLERAMTADGVERQLGPSLDKRADRWHYQKQANVVSGQPLFWVEFHRDQLGEFECNYIDNGSNDRPELFQTKANWDELKIGMTVEEAVSWIGEPTLFRTARPGRDEHKVSHLTYVFDDGTREGKIVLDENNQVNQITPPAF